MRNTDKFQSKLLPHIVYIPNHFYQTNIPLPELTFEERSVQMYPPAPALLHHFPPYLSPTQPCNISIYNRPSVSFYVTKCLG